ISNIASQIKLQAMNTVLEASRTPEAGQQFAFLADQVLSQVHQLNVSIVEIQLLAAEIQTEANEAIAVMEYGAEQAMTGMRLAQETQQKFNQIVSVSDQMKKLVEELVQTAPVQAKTSTSASQSVLEIASIASNTSEQVMAVAKSLDKLSTLAQDLHEDAD
ncbi:MAG: methyl-accepting chemotaxis protein, partial [Brasilonema sp.]